MNNQLTVIPPAELVRKSSDIAGLCKEIVVATAINIQGRSYVKVEGWQSIATAHGCVASAKDVHRVEGGYVATGELRRMSDGNLIATAEGFVGEDEPTWFGGESNGKMLPKRADYAIRAMCQTRAISRVCRSAFAHVVVLMDAGLSTTPAEEVPEGGFNDRQTNDPPKETTKPAPAQTITQSGLTIAEVRYWQSKSKVNFWFVKFGNGSEAATRDEKMGGICQTFAESGKKVDVTVKPTDRDSSKFEIVTLTEADDVP